MNLMLHLTVAYGALEPSTPPVVGEALVLSVTLDDGTPVPGETVTVLHHPGTPRQRELAINLSDGRGRVGWTPTEPGIAELRAGRQLLRVQVQHDTPPLASILTVLLAGLACLGVMVFGLRRSVKS